MITIRTKPVYSKPAEPELLQELGIDLPSKYTTLSQHQALTLKYIRDPEIDVIFNTAMTGDGKSLAAYLPVLKALNGDGSALAMYPTNALIEDQKRQVKNYQKDFGTHKEIDFMDSNRLSELTEEFQHLVYRSDAIRHATKAEILLTNPDIFHYIMNFQYYDPGKTTQHLSARIIEYFNQFIFDEFHVFQIPQVIAVLNAMLFIHYQTRRTDKKKFLFLSATPQEMLRRYLERSGMPYKTVEGEYQHSDQDIPGWRRILHGTEINIVQLTSENTIETWIQENLQKIVEFYERNHDSKGAIIVNSPMTAKRIKAYFQALADSGSFPLTFAENTGLTKDEDSLSKDILIGTSTVDIGVDFEVNFLIFESIDEGTFIQRLGRLGRHDGYDKAGNRITFSEFTAYAMLPKYSYERLKEKLDGKQDLSREEFMTLIKGQEHEESKPVFSSVTQFERYTKQWGVLQTAHILSHTKSMQSQQEFAKELEYAYNSVFQVDMEAMIKRYHAKKNSEDGKKIFEELISFRGTSPFDCGVYDATDNKFKTYNLFQILANTSWQPMEKEEFFAQLEQRKKSTTRYEYAILYLRVNGYNAERENFTLHLRKDLADYGKDYFHKVTVMKGFQLDMANRFINDIKKILRRKKVICLLSKKDRNAIRMKYHLPRLFPVYTVKDEQDRDYSVTFGKYALLLETILYHVPVEQESWII